MERVRSAGCGDGEVGAGVQRGGAMAEVRDWTGVTRV